MNANKDMAYGTFFFDPDERIYADHFPGHAIVPGSLILQAFLQAAGELYPDFCCNRVDNFGFRKFMQPGKYPFTMEMRAERLVCRLLNDGKIMAEGTLQR